MQNLIFLKILGWTWLDIRRPLTALNKAIKMITSFQVFFFCIKSIADHFYTTMNKG